MFLQLKELLYLNCAPGDMNKNKKLYPRDNLNITNRKKRTCELHLMKHHRIENKRTIDLNIGDSNKYNAE